MYQSAVVDSQTFAYLDWEPQGEHLSADHTIIGIHGIGFNAASFQPLIDSLPPRTRFVAYNQRGYAQSPPAYEAKEAGLLDATRVYAQDLANFMTFLVENQKVKPVDSHGQGGITLLGWSKGTVVCTALLATVRYHLDPTSFEKRPDCVFDLTDKQADVLSKFLQGVAFIEPPASSYGLPPRADIMTALGKYLKDPSAFPPEEFATDFVTFFASKTSPEEAFDLASFDPELKAKCYQPEAVPHGFAWRLAVTGPEGRDVSARALSPDVWSVAADTKLDKRLASLPLALIYGNRTIYYLLEAVDWIKQLWSDASNTTKPKRTTKVFEIHDAGHWTFVDQPKQCGQALAAFFKVQEDDSVSKL